VAWQVVRGQYCPHAGHRQRCARVDVFHAGVRQGAEQQLAEKRSLRAKVFGAFRLSGDVGLKIGSDVILADQLVLESEFIRHGGWPSYIPHPA
jgi:hypothetical protein